MRGRLLILTDWYLPGFKGGGPIRSVANLTDALKSDFEIYILTTDTDFGNDLPYNDIKSNCWLKKEKNVFVYYCSKNRLNTENLMSEIAKTSPDFVYLNSMFSTWFAVFPLWLKWRNRIPGKIILAPRGMLQEGAMQFKSLKKKVFLAALRISGVARKITFHATDKQESFDIQKHLRISNQNVKILSNFPLTVQFPFNVIPKKKGGLNLIFISRISPKKNLHLVLEFLSKVKSKINFTIIGPKEDKVYWKKCEGLINNLSENIKVVVSDAIPHNKITQKLQNHHFFILPTKGENFGHIIFESFPAGRPVILSDKTPWRNLESKNIGWDISLNNPEKFISVIEAAAAMNQKEYDMWAQSAWKFGKNYLENLNLKPEYLKLFSKN